MKSGIAGGTVKGMQRGDKKTESRNCEARRKNTSAGVGGRASNEGRRAKRREKRAIVLSRRQGAARFR